MASASCWTVIAILHCFGMQLAYFCPPLHLTTWQSGTDTMEARHTKMRSFAKFRTLLYLTACLLTNILFHPYSLFAEQVVISEIMYHPRGDAPEFLEMHNQSTTPLDMIHWSLAGGVSYQFPDFDPGRADQAFLKAGERIVIGDRSSEELRTFYGIPDSVRVFGPWTGKLGDGGDTIIVKDKNGVTVVQVDYEDSGDWPVAADGLGHSLVLKNGDGMINDPRSWSTSLKRSRLPRLTLPPELHWLISRTRGNSMTATKTSAHPGKTWLTMIRIGNKEAACSVLKTQPCPHPAFEPP
jgi:hypothetical protein